MSNPTEPLTFLDDEKHPQSHPPRVGTIVWGAVVVVLGVLLIVVRQANLSLDPGATAMWLLLGAGAAMVAGGAVNLMRKKSR